jgi:hypothetical protein
MKWIAFLLIISISACKSKGVQCLIDITDIMKGTPGRLITIKDSASKKITALYDQGWDSLKGGAYLFYPNEMLKSYTFYQNRVPVYSENYDELGYLTSTKGSPMVDRIINEYGEDSAYVVVYFFYQKKAYQQLSIKINNNKPVDYTLVRDSVYSNLLTTTFGFSTINMNRINMYSRIKYTDECTKAEHVLSDSIFLVKDAHSGLTPANTK